jgi:malate synthase
MFVREKAQQLPPGVRVLGRPLPSADWILTPAALAFLAVLQRSFGAPRRALLECRAERQRELDAGRLPVFLPETALVRAGVWQVAAAPADLCDRRVEITGPVERKMMINALNSGANVFMADFEDALSPTWENVIAGQANLVDAVRRQLAFSSADGRSYRLNEKTATLVVRPRGWHMVEPHVLVDDEPMSASLFDFGLYFFHNARALLERGSGPYFYLPKLESHLEARLWDDVFSLAQAELGIPYGSIRATVLIETVLAAFEMEEILFELRDHAAGLNAGRWDYIFSVIKKLHGPVDFTLPDRAQITMTVPFMHAYTELLVRTCHRRGAHAIGGMAAFVPSRRDADVNERALAKVRDDKLRESQQGFDGTWVAHPDLVAAAREVFDGVLGSAPHQKARQREDVLLNAAALLDIRVRDGHVSAEGVASNVRVALQYLAAWLDGTGAVAISNLMEDVATAEIARAQLWHWIRRRARLAEGVEMSIELYRAARNAVLCDLLAVSGANGATLRCAATLLDELVESESFVEFLTTPAYRHLDSLRVEGRMY